MKRTLPLILLVLFSLLVSGCTTVSTSGDYTLERGQTLSGNLVLSSGNAILEEDTRVTGNVIMTSGDLLANSEIEGGGVWHGLLVCPCFFKQSLPNQQKFPRRSESTRFHPAQIHPCRIIIRIP